MTDEAPAYVTPSGIEMKRVFSPDNVKVLDEGKDLAHAGEFPFTRGIYETMYRGRLWTMRQYAGYGTSEQTNERFRYLIEHGQTGLSTAFDLPTQIGLDADDSSSAGEVGKVGVHVGTISDMDELFDGISLGEVSTSLTINATAGVLLAFYIALAKKKGVPLSSLRGTVQNDILKEYIARGTYIFPVEPSLRLAVDLIEYCTRSVPGFHPISISGYHMREAGADAVQEVAFTFANAVLYVRSALERGLQIDDFAPKLSFFFGCHNHFLEEIAKFRAARRIWARMMKEEFGARDPRSMALRFHVQTCGSTLTGQQPEINAIRVAIQAMAAALGGCQSLHTNAYDEALGLPTPQSAHLALRTQQVLAHETGVADTVDPVAGSYAVEELTGQMERRIVDKIASIRSSGGMLDAINKGSVQAEIHESSYRFQNDVESGKRKVVGVNCYQKGRSRRGRKVLKGRKIPEVERRQKRKLSRFRIGRDSGAVKKALASLEGAARTPGENLFPYILSCVESRATLGEVCSGLRSVFGEYAG